MKNNWQKVKLDNVVDIIDGDRGENYPRKDEFFAAGDCVFLDTKNVSGTKFDFSNTQFITKEKDRLLRKGKLKRNDFVLTTRGTVGNVAHYGKDIKFDNIRLNSGMVILRPKSNIIDEKFFNLFLISQEFKNQVGSLKSGSAQPQLPIRDLKLFEINLPSFNEQKDIAGILWPLEDKIELNNKINHALEQMAQAIFKEWFVHFRFPGREKVKFMESEMGKIPEGWEVKNVSELVRRLPQGKTYRPEELLQKGDIPVYDQSSGIILGYHNEVAAFSATIDEPVLLFGDHTCRMKLVTHPCSLGPNVVPFAGISYPTMFVYFLTQGEIIQREYKRHWTEFEKQEFIIPPVAFAEKYVILIKSMVQKMVETEKENQSLASLRDLLLPKLMSGSIRV